MVIFKQLFTCCLLLALSYTSASDGEPALNNDNVRAKRSPITGDGTLDTCLGDLLETECCANATVTGLYTLASGEQAYCSDGWVIFQRREYGSVPDFHEKSWEEYATGFGDMSGEFWLGLRKIHQNTEQSGCRLRVDLQSFSYDTAYEEYSQFSVADESNLFRLSVGSFSGTAGDSLFYHNGMAFSTNDIDNDMSGINCATTYQSGGWWNNECFLTAPNGVYGETRPSNEATKWLTWKGNDAIKFIQMKFRCD